MANLKKGRKLSRTSDQRDALLKSLSRSLFLKERIKTTEAKAKEVSVFAEKIITRAKKGGLNSTKFLSEIFDKKTVQKISSDIAPKYKERPGGYSRVIKLGQRKSDGAKMAIIELVK